MEFFATTGSGIEDIAASEVSELLGREARADVGKVIFQGGPIDAALLNYASRSLHRVFITLLRAEAASLEEIERRAGEVDYSGYIEPTQSFAVRAERHGRQPFTSPQIAAAVGRAVIESYMESRSVRLRVNLDEPDIELYALLRDSELLLGLNTTGRSLHERFYRAWHHRAAIQPTLAYAMLRLGGWRDWEALLDPFCGGATIPIEAGLMARKIAPGLRRSDAAMRRVKIFDDEELDELAERLRASEDLERPLRITAADLSPRALEGARMNIEAAGLSGSIRLIQADAAHIHELLDEEPSLIVTNPPFGVRMGIRDPEKFYSEALRGLAKAAPSAKIVLIATKSSLMKRCLERSGWGVTHERRVIYGTLTSSIIVAER